MEQWKKIESTGGYYSVSSEGRVRNNHTGRILRTWVDRTGYRKISLSGGYDTGTKRVTTLVATAFFEEYAGGRYTHLNGNRADDRVENLKEK